MSAPYGRGGTVHGTAGELLALPDATYALLRDLIVERTGVLFDPGKRGLLHDKLSPLVIDRGMTSFLDYYYLLRYDDEAESHWREVMDRLSVPETFFWRQADQIATIPQIVMPMHLAMHAGRRLRIWSAACCTGEEPVSIAIALAEAGMLDPALVEIHATDGSALMLDRARRGSYGERSFRQLPPPLRARYFEPDGDRWRPIASIRNAISWGLVNLANPAEVAPRATADVIFCRNVFIYFADEAIRRVVRAFSDAMPRDGYLFLGSAESLTRLGVDLELAELGGAFVYVKEGRRDIVERLRPRARDPLASPRVSSLLRDGNP